MVATPTGTARRAPRRDKLSANIAQEVLRDIRARGLELGNPLPKEADMLVEYGVGRGTLREAMRLLETCGLISLKPGPGGGPFVEQVNAEDFGRMTSLFLQFAGVTYREVFGARLILEPVAARLAAERQRDTPAAKDLIKLAEAGTDARDENAYLGATADFHSSVIALGGNGVVTLLCQSLGEIYRAPVPASLFPRARQKDVHAAHLDIARAIADGDGESAERLMTEHMIEYTRYLSRKNPALLDEIVR